MYSVFLIPVVAIVAVFTFITVAVWAEERRKERESFYRSETYRRLLDSKGESSETVRELMQEEEARLMRSKTEGRRLGGLITLAVGIGVMVFLYFLAPDEAIYLAGLIPLLIGLVLVIYGYSTSAPPIGGRDAGRDTDRESS